ncbi:MAG: hypothetical protein ACRYFK_13245 [Janthinobacterium lividum]
MFSIIQFIRYLLVRGWLLAGLLGLGLGLGQLAAAAPAPHPADSTRSLVFDRRRLVVQIDSRYSVINAHFCAINGVKLGLEWRGRVRTGAAFYFLSSSIPTRLAPPNNASNDPDAGLRFYNVALYGEYIIIENRRWELGANLQGGLGTLRIVYNTEDSTRTRSPRDFIGLIEPSGAAQMRLFPWVSLGAGAGWRQTMFVPPLVRRELSGPVFYVRAKILLGPLVKLVRNHEPLFSQKDLRVNGLDQRTRERFLR